MKKIFIVMSLILCTLFLSNCASKANSSEAFYPYEKIVLVEAKLETPDPNWIEQIKQQLKNNYNISDITSEKIVRKSKFERWQLEYAATQEYGNEQYPYRFKADLVIWKSESYYAICSINDKSIEAYWETTKLTTEGPREPWVENLVLKVLPAGQSLEMTMGSRVSFIKDKEKKIGPFTVVQTFYIPYPSN